MPFITLLDYLGTVAFAASGALKGVRKGMDVFGVAVLGLATAIGGGTLRDVLLDAPVFWLGSPIYVVLAVGTALGVFALFRVVERSEQVLLIFDAVGLGVFTAIGGLKAWQADAGGVGVVTMACLTGVGGGMLRDVLARDVPFVLREEIYASAAIAGGFALWALLAGGAAQWLALCAATGLTLVIRLLSIVWRWRLPRREEFHEGED
ncbi:MAG: trimeric intracellular cation channel family protein [Planctomycetota bacterium]